MRQLLMLSVVTLAILAIAACTGGTVATPVAGEPAAPAGELEPFIIGITGAGSGGDSILGLTQVNGVVLAAEQLNAQGGINGRRIELVVRDDQNDPSRAATIAQEFINKIGVDVIIGGTNDGTAMVFAEAAKQAGVPFVVPFANGDQISTGNKWAFQVDVASTTFVERAFQFMTENWDPSKIGIVYDDNGFGQADRDFLIEDLAAIGQKPIVSVAIPDTGQDYTAQLIQVRDSGAEVIFTPTSGTNMAQLQKDMDELGFHVPVVGPNSLAFQSMIDVGGEAVEKGVILLDVIDETKPATTKFMEEYYNRFAREVTSGFEPLAYDAMLMVATALKAGGDDAEMVRATLESTEFCDLVSGASGSCIKYSADDHRRADPANLAWRRVEGGKFVNADPNDLKSWLD
jgi:branched-chain amino acid transport system substrate-binding protein